MLTMEKTNAVKRAVPRAIRILLIVALPVLACSAYFVWGRRAPLPEGLIQANGRIEGDQTTVASKFPGRIRELLVREGDQVSAGQLLFTLDDDQVAARLDQARAKVPQANAQILQARHAEAAIQAKVRAASIGLSVMSRDVPLTVENAQTNVVRAYTGLAKAEAAEQQVARDAQRFRTLADRGSLGKQKAEQAELARTAAQKDVETARAEVAQSNVLFSQAQLGPDRVMERSQEMEALNQQLLQARATVSQAVAGLSQFRAGVNEAGSVQADLQVTAPIGGIVATRVHDLGEVVAAGAPVFDLVDLDKLYLKVYVPESQIGKVRLGVAARIYSDAFPNQSFDATVRYISPRAEFTPKEVQTPDERVKLVYAVKLYLVSNPDHRLSPGLPADAVIRWMDSTPWVKPKW